MIANCLLLRREDKEKGEERVFGVHGMDGKGIMGWDRIGEAAR